MYNFALFLCKNLHKPNIYSNFATTMYMPVRIYVRIRIFISHPLAPTALKSGEILKGVY